MSDALHAAIADALAGPGWIGIDEGLDAAGLLAEAHSADLQPARVGTGAQRQAMPELRSDRTRWIDADSASTAQRRLLEHFDALRVALNRALYTGLESVESHYAHYAPGARYGRHRDRFRDDDRRVVSCVLYLNPDWEAADGGALRLYGDDESNLAEVLPQAARLVVFLSERFPHEVLPATRDRYSIAAWFLRHAR